MWFKDTEDCEADEGHLMKWTTDDAESGDPVAQFIQGIMIELLLISCSANNFFNRKTHFLHQESIVLVESLCHKWLFRILQ